jgi:LuxR family maltose regulon positive regulatory protein
MDRAVQACEQDPGYLHALRARIWLAQAEDDPRWLEEAIRWADEHTLADPGQYSWELQSLARVRIAQYRAYGEPDLAPVLDVLEQHLQSGLSRSSGWTCQVLLLIALAHQALGEVDEALVALGRALAVGEHGAPMADLLDEAVRRGIEADYARQVLDAFQAMTRKRREAESIVAPRTGSLSSQAGLVEPLSERELEVLRLLATTLSGPQIADELVISLSTLRSHTKSIYSKLDVHSRLDAVAQGIALGLLAE